MFCRFELPFPSPVPEEKFKAIDIDTASLEAFDGGVLCSEVNVRHSVI